MYLNKRPRLQSEKELYYDRIPMNGSKKLIIYRKVKSEFEYYSPEEVYQKFDNGEYEKNFHNAFSRELKQYDSILYRVYDLKTPLSEQWPKIMEANEMMKQMTYKKSTHPKFPDYCVDITTTGLLKPTVLKHLMVNSSWFKELPNCNTVYLSWEYDMLENASHGPITWCEPFEGFVHMVDIDSMYPSIYGASEDFYFPKRFTGKLESFEIVPEKFQFGIYNNIKLLFPEGCHKIAKMALTHHNGYYAHYELKKKKKLGAKVIKKVADKPIHAVLYQDNELLSHRFFANYLTPLKAIKTLPRCKIARFIAKEMMNSLWGIMCEKAKDKCLYNGLTEKTYGRKTLDFNYKDWDVEDATELDINWKLDKETGEFVVSSIWKRSKEYVGPFPRIKPFILSFARCKMIKLALGFDEDDIIRIHTDSFWLKKQYGIHIPKNDGNDIGKLQYEGYHHVNLKSLNSFVINRNEQQPCQ